MSRVVIVANSHKLQGRCVAGVDLEERRLIRPVSNRLHGELMPEECIASSPLGAVEVSPGDVVEMELGKQLPTSHHPEDVLRSGDWRIVDEMTPRAMVAELSDIIAETTPLLGLVTREAPASHFVTHQPSLSLQMVQCDAAQLYWLDRSNWGRAPQLRVTLTVQGVQEDLAITDPRVENKMIRRDSASLGSCLVTVSLSEPYEKRDGTLWCSKLIAALLTLKD